MGSEKITNGVYNNRVYLPRCLIERVPTAINRISYSDHAKERAFQKNIRLPLSLFDPEIVEIEYLNRIIKVVYRVVYDKTRDLCLVFSMKRRLMCVTVWLNSFRDTHPTLDVEKYVRGHHG